MDIQHRENEIRLEILEAIARSQKALASMAETIAGTYEAGGHDEERTVHELQVLSRYQLSLGEKILGLRIRNRRTGKPLSPWLRDHVRCRKCHKSS